MEYYTQNQSLDDLVFDWNVVASKCDLGIFGIPVEESNSTLEFKQISVYTEGPY